MCRSDQWLNRDKLSRATTRQQVSARVMAMSAGRWDLVRPLKAKAMEEWLETLFEQNLILCRETYRKPETGQTAEPEVKVGDAAVRSMTWSDALSVLRIWEYVGKVRRGYFVAGMSGAQFIRKEDYAYVTQKLAVETDEIVWLHSTDPACITGKAVPHQEGREFMSVPGTVAAFRGGSTTAVFERKGRVLRVFEEEGLIEVMKVFAEDFRNRRLYYGMKRLVVKEYPVQAAAALSEAGFKKEMQDYVLYL